jgi:hypothetical protein
MCPVCRRGRSVVAWATVVVRGVDVRVCRECESVLWSHAGAAKIPAKADAWDPPAPVIRVKSKHPRIAQAQALFDELDQAKADVLAAQARVAETEARLEIFLDQRPEQAQGSHDGLDQ